MNTTLRLILAIFLAGAGLHANAGLFSLEIVEPATAAGDIGTLQILYDGEEENFSFAVGGLDLKLSSSTAGVIKFLDAQVINDDNRWEDAITRDITDDQIGRLFTISIFSPGLAPGSQVFAEVKYSLVGSGFTDLILDVGGEDPLYQGDRGDVSSYVRSRGLCVGECDPNAAPTEINLGDTWAVLREQLYTPPVPSTPQPTPVTPTPADPVIDVPPIAQEPEPIIPVDPEPVVDPPTDTPDGLVDFPVDLPQDVPSVIEIGYDPNLHFIDLVNWGNLEGSIDITRYPFLQVPDWQLLTCQQCSISPQVLVYDGTNLFTRNGQLSMYDGDSSNLAYDGAALAAMRLYSLGTTNAAMDALVPEPHSLCLVVLLSMGGFSFRLRGKR